MKWMRRRRWIQRRECRRMRMMTRSAFKPRNGARAAVPEAARAAVNARLPIAVGRSMTTAAELAAFLPRKARAVAAPQLVQMFGIVTVEALVVPIVAAVPNDQIVVLFWKNHAAFGI